MATWTTIPDSSLEPGKPIRAIDALALRDNPVAIAEGASGAPRVDLPAIVAALAAVPAGSLGSYVFARSTTASDTAFGSTRAGSTLFPTGAMTSVTSGEVGAVSTFSFNAGSALAGTWRCMGLYDYSTLDIFSNEIRSATLWLRIA